MSMYRLMMYFLLAVLGWAIVASAVGLLPYSARDILLQTALLIFLCWGLNEGIARVLKIPANPESPVITALIISAIIGPLSLSTEWSWLLGAAAVAIVSKYVFVLRRSHIFNPAAFGAAAAGLLGFSASWWIGNAVTLPLVLLGGLLIAYKIRRLHLVVSFLIAYTALLVLGMLFVRGGDFSHSGTLFDTVFISSPLLFFSLVMLVEPLTAPQTRTMRIRFGALVGTMAVIPYWFLSAPLSLELCLLFGNLLFCMMSLDFRQSFTLRKKELLSPELRGFWFEPTKSFSYLPGQYLEYTLAHPHADARGIRRYFTIASAPYEKHILLATRFSEPGSSFKKALGEMEEGDEIVAGKVAGEFVLSVDVKKKLVFIAGGIGSTPFRSVAKDLLEKNEHRDIVLLYAAREEKDLVFRDVFTEAEKIGMKNVYILSEAEKVPPDWVGRTGRLDANMIEEEIPDAKERIFYVSGPEPMVKGISTMLIGMGIPRARILRDYFPGYAADPEGATFENRF